MEKCLQKDFDLDLEEISLESDLDSEIKKLKGTKLDNTPQIKNILNSVTVGEELQKEINNLINDELLKDSIFVKDNKIIQNSLQLDIFTKKENIKSSIQSYLKQNTK